MTAPPEQAEVVAFLRGLAGSEPLETHISLVFVGADTVWKLKKAVRLAFLDFTALEARRRFALRELELNRAGGARAVPRCRAGGAARGRHAGLRRQRRRKAIDWVLRMARVPAGDFLDAVAAAGGLTPELLDALGDAVAAFHRGLAPATGIDAVAAMRRVVEGNARSARDAGLAEDAVQAWQTRILAALDGIAPWLARRARDGFVRRAHGDLHLGNLCLWQRPAGAVRCAGIRRGDGDDRPWLRSRVPADGSRPARLAGGGEPRAEPLRRAHRRRRADRADCRCSCRCVRWSARMSRRSAATADIAARYLARGRGLSSARSRPIVLAIGGLPGSGKSTLARALAPDLGNAPGALVLRSDEIRKRQHGVAPEQRLPQSAYSDAASEAVFAALAALVARDRARRACGDCRCNVHRSAPPDA